MESRFSSFFKDSLMFPMPKSFKRKSINELKKRKSTVAGFNGSNGFSVRSSGSQFLLQMRKVQVTSQPALNFLPGAFLTANLMEQAKRPNSQTLDDVDMH
jgi:hypothetical protein